MTTSTSDLRLALEPLPASTDDTDPLFERWLDRPPSRPRRTSRPPPPSADAGDGLGDTVADAWFR